MQYDISGTQGNIYAIVGTCVRFAKQIWPDDPSKVDEIHNLITANSPCKDYHEVLAYLKKMFCGSVEFVNGEEDEDDM